MPKNWRLLILRAKNCHHLGPTVNEKKTNNDNELVGLVLENKTTAHNLNETSRSSINFETSEFDFLERNATEEDNNEWQTFPDNLSKSEQHDPTQPKLSVYPWRFYGDDKTLESRFQTSLCSEYPWIEYSIKEDAPVCFCCELPFLEKTKLSISSLVLRD